MLTAPSASPLWRLVARKSSSITALTNGATGPAFYGIHCLFGGVTHFWPLARLLGTEQKFYGVQAPIEKLNANFAASIESMARYYADALCAFQPEGPLLLGGWSAGAAIALEMAQQLKTRGREVPLLVVIDGPLWNTGGGVSAWNPLYYWKLACNLPRWIGSRSFSDLKWRVRAKLKVGRKLAMSTFQGESARYGHMVAGFMDVERTPEAQVSFMKALFNAIYQYTPQEYTGPVLVYAATTQPLHHLFQVEAVWAKIAARTEVVPISGTHASIIGEPHVIALADHLRKRLAEFRLRPGPILESRPKQFDYECLSQEALFQRALEPG
jgi:thioesterase domain-containing protein